jgi:hypothetical protein
MPEMGDADTADAKAPAIALPAVRWPAPNAALMSAAEVLAWIAFGHVPKADSAIGTIDNDIDTTLRWQHTRLDRTVAAVEAMIAGRWVPATIRGTWPPEAYACHPAWDEQGQEWIESLRLHLGRQDGRDISLHDLAQLLQNEITRQQRASLLLDGAQHELLETLRAGNPKSLR